MTVEEIFNKLASHMVEGIMYHDDMAKAFDFLGLHGYAKCQDYHHFEETKNYRELSHYYATHYFKLLQVNIEQPQIIPETWFKYSSQAVDNGTKRNAIKEIFTKWKNWEESTKKLYQELYTELTNLSEGAAAIKISKYLSDVDAELHDVWKELLTLEAINYNLDVILPNQKELRKKYKKLSKKLF